MPVPKTGVYANQQVDVLHMCYDDVLENLMTGLGSGDFTVTLLYKTEQAANWSSASETVTFVNEPATGNYHFKFTPTNAGLYNISISNDAVGSSPLVETETISVLTNGATFSASFDDAFCSEEDVENHFGRAVSATSKPTTTEVAGFARLRASEIRSLIAAQGATITPDSGTAPVDTSTNEGFVLRDLLRLTNALGAAMDATDSAFVGVTPVRSQKAADFEDQYRQALKAMINMVKVVYGVDIQATSPYSENDVDEYDTPSDAEGRQPFAPWDGDW